MTAGPHPNLADPTRWAAEAAELIADLGFTLINGDDPAAPGEANLLVGLRPVPTLRHFDPEEIGYWVTRGDRGRLAQLTRETAGISETPFSWGRIEVVDRLGERNRFIAFGGVVRVADPSPQLRVVCFHGPAPIVRWSGHSQGWDDLAGDVGAFFGRLLIRVDVQPDAESLVGAAAPAAIYAAFLQDVRARFTDDADLLAKKPATGPFLHQEAHRLEAERPDAWREGAALLRSLGLARSVRA